MIVPRTATRSLRILLTPTLIALAGAAHGQAQVQTTPAESATEPVPRTGSWVKMHEKFLDRAKAGPIDLLFLGDSITAGYTRRDKDGVGPGEIWDRYYGARNAADFGIGGDRTQHVLWRLENGEVDGIKPRVVVLMIGTNNSGRNSAPETAEGVTKVVTTLRKKLPETKILLLGIFPRGKEPNPQRDRINAVNETISRLDDGKSVKYLDIGKKFLNDDGTISKEIMPDYLHLTRKGYAIWADAIEPTLWELMEGK